eukprot:263138-Pyramimonas_sp.AAC.1
MLSEFMQIRRNSAAWAVARRPPAAPFSIAATRSCAALCRARRSVNPRGEPRTWICRRSSGHVHQLEPGTRRVNTLAPTLSHRGGRASSCIRFPKTNDI